MQLLEQLAFGYTSNVTSEQLAMECASTMGYVECLMEMTQLDIVTEGIDVKTIVSKVIGFIKTYLKKLRDLFVNAINFVKGKIKKKPADASRSNSSEPSDNRTNDSEKKETSDSKSQNSARLTTTKNDDQSGKEENKENKTQYRTNRDPIGIGQKSKDEMIEDILKQNPYTGKYPTSIAAGVNNVETLLTDVIIPTGGYIHNMITYIEDAKEDDGNKPRQSHRIARRLYRDADNISEFSYILKLDQWANSDGIKSPSDIPKFAMRIYENPGNVGKVLAEKEVISKTHFDQYQERFSFAQSTYYKAMPKYVDRLQGCMDRIQKDGERCIKELESISNWAEKNDVNINEIMTLVTNGMNMLMSIVSNTLSCLPTVFNKIETDISVWQRYQDMINAKINAIH